MCEGSTESRGKRGIISGVETTHMRFQFWLTQRSKEFSKRMSELELLVIIWSFQVFQFNSLESLCLIDVTERRKYDLNSGGIEIGFESIKLYPNGVPYHEIDVAPHF